MTFISYSGFPDVHQIKSASVHAQLDLTEMKKLYFILLFFYLQRISTGRVVRIVDGDTLVILYHSKNEKVRLIGIDTPETVHTKKPVQCYGPEASNFMKKMVSGKKVKIEDSHRDRYGRLLAFVYLMDGRFINKKMIETGHAFAYTKYPFKFSKKFKEAEKKAKQHKIGLWGVCEDHIKKLPNGDFTMFPQSR